MVIRRVLAAAVVLLALASISFSRSRSFELVDQAGAPGNPAYLAYSYSGSRLNFVHPVSYEAEGSRTLSASSGSQRSGRSATRDGRPRHQTVYLTGVTCAP